MLGQRIATAIVLLAVLLPTIFWWPAWTWEALTLAFLAVGAREWVALLGGDRAGRQARIAAAALVAAGIFLLAWRHLGGWPDALGFILSAAAVLWWCVAGSLRLAGASPRSGGPLLAGFLLLACWVALIELHARGPVVLLAAMAIVWIADIAAYFFGRAFGRRKLAPRISPGKSWEGAIGGALAVLVAGGLVAWGAAAGNTALGSTLPARLAEAGGIGLAVPALLGLTALSVMGDLHESLLKRAAGVKDSGTLLPGHGGVLDRIDALIPVIPAVSLLHWLLG
jgi:phosphatidate cytidylyltransferase